MGFLKNKDKSFKGDHTDTSLKCFYTSHGCVIGLITLFINGCFGH